MNDVMEKIIIAELKEEFNLDKIDLALLPAREQQGIFNHLRFDLKEEFLKDEKLKSLDRAAFNDSINEQVGKALFESDNFEKVEKRPVGFLQRFWKKIFV